MRLKKINKKAIETNLIVTLIITVVLIVVMTFAYMILSGKMIGGWEYIKNFLRFGVG